MMAPKWFDKNLQLSNEDNFEQLRDVLRMAREAYLSDAAAATAFGHFARHHDSHLRGRVRAGLQPAAGELRPGADRPRGARRAVPRARRFLLRGDAGQPAPASARQHARVRRLRLRRASCARLQPSGTHRSAPHRGHAGCDHGGRPRSERVGDGLPETLEEVIAGLRPPLLQAQGGRPDRRRPGAAGGHRRGARPLDRSPTSFRWTATSSIPMRTGVAELVARHPRPRPRSRGCGTPSSSSSSRSPASWRWTPTCARPTWASR